MYFQSNLRIVKEEVDVSGVMYTVYLVTNKKDGKQYVGRTRYPIRTRWTQHLNYSKRGGKPPLAEAIRNDSKDAFVVEALVTCRDETIANEYEDTLVPKGYNQQRGGQAPRHNQEIRDKMSQTKRKQGLDMNLPTGVARIQRGYQARYGGQGGGGRLIQFVNKRFSDDQLREAAIYYSKYGRDPEWYQRQKVDTSLPKYIIHIRNNNNRMADGLAVSLRQGTKQHRKYFVDPGIPFEQKLELAKAYLATLNTH